MKKKLIRIGCLLHLINLLFIVGCINESTNNNKEIPEKKEDPLSLDKKKEIIGKINWAFINGKQSEAMTLCNNAIEVTLNLQKPMQLGRKSNIKPIK